MKQTRVVTTFEVTTVPKDGADGKDGKKGARMRMRDWATDTDYLSGSDGEEWYDVVDYSDMLYLCLTSHRSGTTTPQEDVANHGGNWEAATEWVFIATKLLLAERIKSDMIDTSDLVAKRIYTDTKVEEDGTANYAHIEMSGSEMKVFNPEGLMNIRFGVNEDGYAVMEYYDNDGRKLYDLGPNGITDIPVSEESWTELWYEKLGDSEQEVLEARNYKKKYYNSANKVYKYHSKVVAGVVNDADNNGRLFIRKSVADTNILEDGIYRVAPSSTAGQNVFPMVNDAVVEDALLAGKTELDEMDLSGLSLYNETVKVRNPVYFEILYRCSDGFMAQTDTVAYWNGKPTNSESDIVV